MSFSNLKKESSLGSLTAKLQKEVEKLNSSASNSDERLWKPEVDKTGNGYAVIRFLPAPNGEEYPWVKMYNHAFQAPGGWLIDNCPTSFGGKCPICQENTLLWNSGIDANKEIVRVRKRKMSYYSNIYVVKDPANPQNEGRVFLYKYGKKIFDKITVALKPEFEDETPIDAFDFWKGADFKLKIKKVAGYWNYDSSEFARPSALLDDDEALEAIWNKEYSLSAIVAADQFKSYDQLKDRLNVVLGKTTSAPAATDESFEDEDDYRSPAPTQEEVSVGKSGGVPSRSASSSFDDDDDLSYFQRLAEEF